MYKCNICGYIYHPEEGDGSQGILGGTSFSDLPASWRCPVCNVTVEDFEPFEE
jgi:rubredoxin